MNEHKLVPLPTVEVPEPPRPLAERGVAFWEEVNTTFDLSDEPHKVELLCQACETLDTIAALEVEARQQPLIMRGSMKQPVANPLVVEARHQRTALNGLIKALGLPETRAEEAAKAAWRTARARKAGSARWGNQ